MKWKDILKFEGAFALSWPFDETFKKLQWFYKSKCFTMIKRKLQILVILELDSITCS